jgi:uncharacterized protein YqhQ
MFTSVKDISLTVLLFFEICGIFIYLFVISSRISFVEKIVSSLLLLPMSEFKMILPTLLHLRFTFSLYKLTPTYATITV